MAQALDADDRALAVELLAGPAAGNAVVVKRLLRAEGVEASLRTVQPVVAPTREAHRPLAGDDRGAVLGAPPRRTRGPGGAREGASGPRP